jgi:hypothetical protein
MCLFRWLAHLAPVLPRPQFWSRVGGSGPGSDPGLGFGGAIDTADITEPMSFFVRILVKLQLEKKNRYYIPALASFSYFIFASSQVVSESPSRASTRSIPSPLLNCRIAHVSRKICADTFFLIPAFSAVSVIKPQEMLTPIRFQAYTTLHHRANKIFHMINFLV